jgi:hypothetical protein
MAGLTGWHLVMPLVAVAALFVAWRPDDSTRRLGRSARLVRADLSRFAEAHQVGCAPDERPTATGIGALPNRAGGSRNGGRGCST